MYKRVNQFSISSFICFLLKVAKVQGCLNVVLKIADGIPVHLKGGPVDRILFGATVGLCLLGMAMGAHTIYVMAYPKKP